MQCHDYLGVYCRSCPTVPSHRICMVGDNLKTDIDFGRSHGIGTILVETGIHTRHDLEDPDEASVIPDFVIPSIASLGLPSIFNP